MVTVNLEKIGGLISHFAIRTFFQVNSTGQVSGSKDSS